MINYLNFKDYKNRQLIVKKELLKYLTVACLTDSRISFKSRFLFKSKINDRVLKLAKSGIVKVRNRCKETGRSRFIVSYVGLSRAQFKFKVSSGFLSGFKKN